VPAKKHTKGRSKQSKAVLFLLLFSTSKQSNRNNSATQPKQTEENESKRSKQQQASIRSHGESALVRHANKGPAAESVGDIRRPSLDASPAATTAAANVDVDASAVYERGDGTNNNSSSSNSWHNNRCRYY